MTVNAHGQPSSSIRVTWLTVHPHNLRARTYPDETDLRARPTKLASSGACASARLLAVEGNKLPSEAESVAGSASWASRAGIEHGLQLERLACKEGIL